MNTCTQESHAHTHSQEGLRTQMFTERPYHMYSYVFTCKVIITCPFIQQVTQMLQTHICAYGYRTCTHMWRDMHTNSLIQWFRHCHVHRKFKYMHVHSPHTHNYT